jgi:hypothetical protein
MLASFLNGHPDRLFVEYLISTLRNGADIGYQGLDCQRSVPNNSSARDRPHIVLDALLTEVSLGHCLDPFDRPPFDLSSINALGIVDKSNGGHRIILDLSQPDNSVNSHINKEDFPLSVSNIDDAIKLISDTGTGAFLAKVDLKQAYRQVPVQKSDWHFLCHHIMGYYFLDTVLPFGLRSSAAIFCCLAKLSPGYVFMSLA